MNYKELPHQQCPVCNEIWNVVSDTRLVANGIRRRRKCEKCNTKWSTIELLIVGTITHPKET